MNRSYIKALTYYLPKQALTNEELSREFSDPNIEKTAGKVGIDVRYIAAEDETAGDMAEQAARNLFQEYNLAPETIDFLILCTQSPDYFLPATACVLQHRLGIPSNAGAIDFNQGCSGYLYGLALAKGLIAANVAKNILLLTAETYSKHIHPQDKANRILFGDAASATLISNEGFAAIGEFSLGTDGAGANNLIVKTGGMKHKNALNDFSIDENGTVISSDHLFLNGAEIFSFTQEKVPLLIKSTLLQNGLEQEQIDLFVFHQSNRFMLDFLRKKIKIDEDKFYYCLSRFGNTVSSTIPIALKEAMADKTIKVNNKILLASYGVGYSWAGVVLNF
jgi:3-oxoacyl-[acyl-carrier-protein] synthase III